MTQTQSKKTENPDLPEGARPRGRPRSYDRDVQIRDAAWKIIAQVGCAGLSIEGLAKTIGCAKSTLYRRFENKGDLILNLLDETALPYRPLVDIDAPPREQLLTHARFMIDIYGGHRGGAYLHIMAAARSDTSIAQALAGHRALILPYYRNPLRALVPKAADEAIDFALNMLVGSLIYVVAVHGNPPSEDQIMTLIDCVVSLAEKESDKLERQCASRAHSGNE